MLKTLRPLLILFLLVFLSQGLWAQDPRLADSLFQDLKAYGKRDSLFLDKMQALEVSLLFVMPDSVLRLARTSQHVADSLQDPFRLARATNIAGNCFKTLGMFDKAMQEFVKALKLFEKVDDQKWIANMHSNIGLMHLNDGQFALALQEQEQALAIRAKIKYTKGISGTYNTIGNIYSAQRKMSDALHWYELALDSAASEGPYFAALYMGNIGNTYGQLKQYEICREMNRQALSVHSAMGLPQEIARDLHNIGEAFLLEGLADSAIHYNEAAMGIADSVAAYDIILACALDFMRAYAGRKNFEMAYQWSEKAIEAKDSITQQQVRNETHTMELMYLVEKEEQKAVFSQEKALLQKDADLAQRGVYMVILGVGVLALLAAGAVLWRANRQKKISNAKLEFKVAERTHALSEANAQLSAEIDAKEAARMALHTFIYRSSHDLKGPLTTIKGLVQVAENEANAAHYLPMIGAKAAQLDGVLQQLIDKVEVDARSLQLLPIDLPAMWAELESELSNRAGFQEVEFELQVGGGEPILADPLLLKIALRQLLQNAIDFRRKDEPGNAVRVIAKGGGSHWRLAIADQGIGIAPGQLEKAFEMFQRNSHQSVGAGLGLFIVREAATKMGLQLSAEPAAAGGTVITLGH